MAAPAYISSTTSQNGLLSICRVHMTSPATDRQRPGRLGARTSGFTLIELLTVVGVMALMMGLTVPAFDAIRGGSDFSSELYDISGTLEQARAYAMANNTYVLAGMVEVSNSLSASAASQPATPAGAVGGRIAIAVIASRNGTRPYQTSINLRTFTGSTVVSSSAFLPVTKLMQFQNLHLVDLQTGWTTPSLSGGMQRFTVQDAYNIPSAKCSSVSANSAMFTWPLGAATPQYTFTKVIEFDPQGAARIINSTTFDAIPQYIEVGLEPSHGATASTPPPTQTGAQIAAIQVDGMSGASRLFRP